MFSNRAAVILAGVVLATIQFIAALPWLWAIDTKGFKQAMQTPLTLLYAGLGLIVAGLGVGLFLSYKGEASSLMWNGRYVYAGFCTSNSLSTCSCSMPHRWIRVAEGWGGRVRRVPRKLPPADVLAHRCRGRVTGLGSP